MKTYFQIQNARKMRVYQIEADKTDPTKRKQTQLGIISVNSKIPKDIFDKLTADDQQELIDRMKMLRDQAEYETTRQEIRELPNRLARASKLLASKKLLLTEEQRKELLEQMNPFLRLLRPIKEKKPIIETTD